MEGMRCYRPLIIGRRGAVAANHPLAAQAGLLALRALRALCGKAFFEE